MKVKSAYGSAFSLMVSLAIVISSAGFAFSQSDAATKRGTLERPKVHGKSLEGNLERDSPDRDVSIYLPPSYKTDPHRRYPVIYLLHGFMDKDDNWFLNPKHFVNAPVAIDKAFSTGTPEMIVVMPNAYTLYAGSMYSNSATAGDWEDFIAHDLVAYIDSHYRTIPDRMSRGLAGHSMGGYGAIRMGMKHPEVFSSVYSMSACCLAPLSNLQPSGITEIESVHGPADLAKASFFTRAAFASAAAWSPNPSNPPLFIDLPVKNGQVQENVTQKWVANAPLVMIDQYIPSLKALHAIAFDIGAKDNLVPPSTMEALDRVLTTYGIAHTYETYDGDHVNGIGMRLENRVLPFFSKNLSFAPVRE